MTREKSSLTRIKAWYHHHVPLDDFPFTKGASAELIKSLELEHELKLPKDVSRYYIRGCPTTFPWKSAVRVNREYWIHETPRKS